MITFIVNGENVEIECSDQDTLQLLVKIALTETNNLHRPIENWQVRDQTGVLLPQEATIGKLRIDKTSLFLMPKLGAGGIVN